MVDVAGVGPSLPWIATTQLRANGRQGFRLRGLGFGVEGFRV